MGSVTSDYFDQVGNQLRTLLQLHINTCPGFADQVAVRHKPVVYPDACNQQQYNEYIFTSLRTIWGIELDYIETRFGKDAQQYFKQQIQNWINQEKVKQQNNNFTLTKKGKLYTEAIASDLFIV